MRWERLDQTHTQNTILMISLDARYLLAALYPKSKTKLSSDRLFSPTIHSWPSEWDRFSATNTQTHACAIHTITAPCSDCLNTHALPIVHNTMHTHIEQQPCLPLDRSCVAHSASAHHTNGVHRQWTLNEVSTTYTRQVHTRTDRGNERSRRKGIQRRRSGGSERVRRIAQQKSERYSAPKLFTKNNKSSGYSPMYLKIFDYLLAIIACGTGRVSFLLTNYYVNVFPVDEGHVSKFGSFNSTKSGRFIWICHIEEKDRTYFAFTFVQRTTHWSRFLVEIAMPIPRYLRSAVLRRIVDAINTLSRLAIKCMGASDSSDKLTVVACKQRSGQRQFEERPWDGIIQ